MSTTLYVLRHLIMLAGFAYFFIEAPSWAVAVGVALFMAHEIKEDA